MPAGLPVGLRRGHQTTLRELKPRPSARKGRSSASRQLVTGVIREVAGFAPYERRAMELLRNGKDKKVRRRTRGCRVGRRCLCAVVHARDGTAAPPEPLERDIGVSRRSAAACSLEHTAATFSASVICRAGLTLCAQARKLVKARLGTLRRAKRKVDDLTGIIAEARRTGH